MTRTHIGQVYVNVNTTDYNTQITSGVAHESYTCKRIREHKLLDRVPMFEEDEQLYITFSQREMKVRKCETCADTTFPDYTWQDQALCAELRLDMFTSNKKQRAQNTRVCVECPVRVKCLEFAVATGEQAGMWGGVLFSYRSWETRQRIDAFNTRVRNK